MLMKRQCRLERVVGLGDRPAHDDMVGAGVDRVFGRHHAFLIVGLVLSPTKILGNGSDFFDCEGTDVFASYERAGRDLSDLIEPGSKIYWEGRIPAIFLYLPDVKVYGPQLNHVHYYVNGGDADTLLRFGYWNDALSERWLSEADFIIVEARLVTDGFKAQVAGQFEELQPLGRTNECRPGSEIHIYRRLQ